MKYVPHWVIDAIMSKRFKCHDCKKSFATNNVKGLGVRESRASIGKEVFFAEFSCTSCGKATFFELQEMNIIELSDKIMKEIDTDKLAQPKKEFNDEDLFGKDIEPFTKEDIEEYKKEVEVERVPPKRRRREISRITLKEVKDAARTLRAEDFTHDKFLEMLGLPPEEIARYKEEETE